MSVLARRLMMAAGAGGDSDPYWSDTVLLMHFDGNFVDATGRHNFSIINGTSPTFTSSQSGFGQCGSFAGNGSIRATDNLTDFNFPTGQDFTIEAFFKLTTSSTAHKDIVTILGGRNLSLGTNNANNAIHAWNMPTIDIVESGSISLNTWYHVAACRASGVTRLFINGVLADSAADTENNIGATHIEVGGWNGNEYWYGQIDELRITRAARYTTNFTPPANEF